MADPNELDPHASEGGLDPWLSRRRSDRLVVIILTSLFATALLLIGFTVYMASLRQDELQRAHEEGVVAASLSTLRRSMAGNIVDYARWDEAVRHVALSFDRDWIARNVGPNIDATFGYDLSLIRRGSGPPLIGYVDGTENTAGAGGILGMSLDQIIDAAMRKAEMRPLDPVVAILSSPAGPLMVAANAIVPEDGSVLAPPASPIILVFAKRLDHPYLDQVALDFGLHGLAFQDAPVPADGRATVPLLDIAGDVIGAIAWEPARPGRNQLVWLLPALAGAMLAVVVFAHLALQALRLAAAVRTSEAELKDLAEVSSDWFWRTDDAHRFVWFSKPISASGGLTALDLDAADGNGAGLTDQFGDHDPQAYRVCLAEHRPFRDRTIAYSNRNGPRRIARISGRPVTDAAGRFAGYRGSGRDVTDEWEAQSRLRESEARFRSLVENLRGIIFCRGVQGPGTHDYDEQGVQVFGADAAQLAGTGNAQVRARLTAWYEAVHPEDREPYLAAEERRKRLHEPYQLEYRIAHPATGQERWMREVAWVVQDERTASTYLDCYIVDITEQKQVEASLEAKGRENAIYRAIFEVMPDQVYYKDLECRFVVANEATSRLIGVSDPASLAGESDLSLRDRGLLDSATAQRFYDDERDVLNSGQPRYLEQKVVTRQAGTTWLGVLKVPVRDQRGRVVGLVGHGRDITENKVREAALAEARAQLEEQNLELRQARLAAEDASRAKSEFLAAMSHEIRTPMTGVLGMADLLATESLDMRQKGYVEAIRSSGRHLLAVVNDILDFSRIEAGRMELEQVDFSVLEVIERVRSLMAPQAVERGLDLSFHVEAQSTVTGRGDPTRLQQVLLNLVGNGLKFTSSGGVEVEAASTPAGEGRMRFRFEVRDTGIGIQRDRLTSLFEPFSQADRSTTRRYGGSGLGLAISKRLVSAMGGTMGVQSEPGAGSRFWFEVPLEIGNVATANGRATFEPATLRPLRILLAEDVALNRELLREMLGRYGHRVVFAMNGAEAVAIAGRETFDLILMDVQMPVMDGIQATRRIRRLAPPHGMVPIAALTANVMEEERQRCLVAGMNQVITKPVAWPDLFGAMKKLTRDHEAESPHAKQSVSQVHLSASSDVPLLDRSVLAEAEKWLGGDTLRRLMLEAAAEAERAHVDVSGHVGNPEEIRRVLHRLRSVNGNFGLARIAAVAEQIEVELNEGGDVGLLVTKLAEVTKATRHAIERATLLS